MKKILITAPVRQDPDIFAEYLKALDALEVPDGCEIERFFVINDCPEVIPLLRDTDRWTTYKTECEYLKTHNDHIWTLDNMDNMARMRNMTIVHALENWCDYWWSVDSDVMVRPETLRILLQANKDIVSEIFWTRAPSGKYWCNAWMEDQASGMPEEWRKPGLYACGMTGACTLVKREVLDRGVNYSRIPNIRTALRGEDRHFCVRAACAGYQCWIDSHAPAEHLYTRELYNQYMAGRKGNADV